MQLGNAPSRLVGVWVWTWILFFSLCIEAWGLMQLPGPAHLEGAGLQLIATLYSVNN